MDDLIPLTAAAKRLGCSPSFLRRRCADGSLPAVRIGTDYRVQWADVLVILQNKPTAPSTGKGREWATDDLVNLQEAWIVHLQGVRSLAPTTIGLYQGLLRTYLRRLAAVGYPATGPASLFDRQALAAVFAKLPPRSFNTRQNTYIMLRSFGSFLVAEGKLAPNAMDGITPLKPRRATDARQTCLKAADVPRLFDCIFARQVPPGDNIVFAGLVACMVYAGLRVSEACALRPQDIDLATRVIYVRHGKGGRDRRVGICNALYRYLADAQAWFNGGPTFFARPNGKAWDRNTVGKRMQAIARRLGVDITAHVLRRTFATAAAGQGRSTNAIRIALGHTSLVTTQQYLKTAEAEVIDAMTAW